LGLPNEVWVSFIYLVGGWNIFYFSIYWQLASQLTSDFSEGWLNHQPVMIIEFQGDFPLAIVSLGDLQ